MSHAIDLVVRTQAWKRLSGGVHALSRELTWIGLGLQAVEFFEDFPVISRIDLRLFQDFEQEGEGEVEWCYRVRPNGLDLIEESSLLLDFACRILEMRIRSTAFFEEEDLAESNLAAYDLAVAAELAEYRGRIVAAGPLRVSDFLEKEGRCSSDFEFFCRENAWSDRFSTASEARTWSYKRNDDYDFPFTRKDLGQWRERLLTRKQEVSLALVSLHLPKPGNQHEHKH